MASAAAVNVYGLVTLGGQISTMLQGSLPAGFHSVIQKEGYHNEIHKESCKSWEQNLMIYNMETLFTCMLVLS